MARLVASGDWEGGTGMALVVRIHPKIRPLGYFLFNKSLRLRSCKTKW